MQEMVQAVGGEDGIRRENVIVTVRNAAGQTVREVEIERILEDGGVRQTTVRAVGYDTLTSQAHELRAVSPIEARAWVADAEERGLLTTVATMPAEGA